MRNKPSNNPNTRYPKQVDYNGIKGEELNKKVFILKQLSVIILRLNSTLNRENFYSNSSANNMQVASSLFFELMNNYKVNISEEYTMLMNADKYFKSNQFSNGLLIMRNLAGRFKFKS